MSWKVYQTDPYGFRYANIEDGNGHLIFQSLHAQTDEWQGRALKDALLAAAAPDLLEAAKAAKTALETIIMLSTELNKKSKADLVEYVRYLDRVIAKAEGAA